MDPKVIKAIDWAVTAVLGLAVIALIFSIRVSGREINGISEMTDTNCTVTITTYQHMEWDDRVEHTLTPEQMEIVDTNKNSIIEESEFNAVYDIYFGG